MQYIEYQSVYPLVGIGAPLPRKRVWLPPGSKLGETHSLAEEGMGRPNSNEETETLVFYVYFIVITLRISFSCGMSYCTVHGKPAPAFLA